MSWEICAACGELQHDPVNGIEGPRCEACNKLVNQISFLYGLDVNARDRNGEVIVSPTMEINIGELQSWLSHHHLNLSVGFSYPRYKAVLTGKGKAGDAGPLVQVYARDFGEAVVSACQNYEREESPNG